MPRSGSGVYAVPPGSAAVSLGTISSTAFNTLLSDLETALTDSLSKSGNGGATADISMGSHKITNLTAGVAATDAANVSNLTAGYQPLDADLTALAALAATGGVLARTGAAAFLARTLTAGAGISIADGDGVAANPVITAAVSPPQGRLTLTSGLAVLAADVLAATALYYTPYNGNVVPIYNGTLFVPKVFAELTLTLAAQHASKAAYDVFVFVDTGAVILGTGPAWSVPGNYVSAGTLTPGTAARGTGAATTELELKLGLWTNKVSITARNGATTYTVTANQGTYLGTIWIDATAGQLTCHVSIGQNRKWGVWNAYNRVPITLVATDTSNQWSYLTATTRAANGNAANSCTLLSGLPEEQADFDYHIWLDALSGAIPTAGVGYNSSTVFSGSRAAGTTAGISYRGTHNAPPFLGCAVGIACENGGGAATCTWSRTTAPGPGEPLMRFWAKHRA